MSRRRRSRNGGRNGRGRRRRWAPNLFVAEGLDIDTADTVANSTIFTNSNDFPFEVEFRSAKLGAASGGTGTAIYSVIRRVPQGYSAPSIAVTTGTTSFADEADVFAYAYLQWVPSPGANMSVSYRPVFPRQTLYAGDTVVVQAVAGTTSAGLVGGVNAELWSGTD